MLISYVYNEDILATPPEDAPTLVPGRCNRSQIILETCSQRSFCVKINTSWTPPYWADEKMEDLGRGAVVRLIGHLGMGRYAHRFRAFGVTGSDLASCTEEDLVQLGICFRYVKTQSTEYPVWASIL